MTCRLPASRIAVAGLFVLLGLQLRVGAQEAPVVSLDQAIEAALSTGDRNKIIEGQLAVAKEQYQVSAAKNSPALSASAGYNEVEHLGRSSSSGGTGTPEGPQAGLTFSGPRTSVSLNAYPYVQPSVSGNPDTGTVGLTASRTLWDGYRGGTARAVVQKSQLSLQQKELTADSDRVTLVSDVKQAYFTTLSAQGAVALSKEQLVRQKALLDQMTALHNLEQATAVDLASARIKAQSAEIDVASAQNDLRIARIRLANLIGRPAQNDFTVAEVDTPQMPALSLQEAIAQGMSGRTDLQQIEVERQASDIDLALAKAQRSPGITATGGVSWTVDWNGADSGSGTGSANAGLKITLPLLDSGAAAHQRAAVSRQLEVYGAQESQLKSSIAADIEDAYRKAQIQIQKVETARLNADNLQAQYEIAQVKLANGTATNQDLIDASVNLSDAQNAYQQARTDAQLAVVRLETAMGKTSQ